ncbi:hypothetical protein SAMN03159343_2077 [Klenkia marina]|uniref:Uncharacterized protein n=1 Tax=Klenkia marina TaxID=1960309 RepID=A0A1G4Y6F4_9ACTN|nr:hypothetical protein [Klenkia marina]SCX48973.1 hypothetical protein SAMN03159343_2077 [Klenkia marina]
MTAPNTSPAQRLAEALGSGNPRRAAAEVERYVAHAIYMATGKTAREPLQMHSTTLREYR